MDWECSGGRRPHLSIVRTTTLIQHIARQPHPLIPILPYKLHMKKPNISTKTRLIKMAMLLHSLPLLLSLLLYSSSMAFGGDFMMNQIDQCWRWNLNWASDRQSLADCAVGFGKEALGGKLGSIYIVNDTSDDPVNPAPGTLRWAVIQEDPLWIIFDRDMSFTLKNELIINSYKTIDGRGVKVEIAHGPCITIQDVSHVIIHGISIHDCTQGSAGIVASNTTHVGQRLGSDGDGITIFGSSNIWIDHCSLASCLDGLIDATHASTAVTISNCYFTSHDKVILFGHDDSFTADVDMKITLAFNYFGPGLVQRMPRVRFGYAHVANNRYEQWEMYAIGGSADPTILSQGNYFNAPSNPNLKEVTKREGGAPDWKNWKWRSSQDFFLGGAFFVQSGWGSCPPDYTPAQAFLVMDGSMVPLLTGSAGVLSCVEGSPCIGWT